MKLKLRDLLIVSAVLFLGFIAYSNFSTLAKNWTSTNCYKNIQSSISVPHAVKSINVAFLDRRKPNTDQ